MTKIEIDDALNKGYVSISTKMVKQFGIGE